MASFPPKVVRSGICQQVVLEGERARPHPLPIIQCWPLDGDLSSGQAFDAAAAASAALSPDRHGRYITPRRHLHPQPEHRRPQLRHVPRAGLRPAQGAMHWHMHHDGARHFRLWQKRGERMPLAIVLGGQA
jgi:4-hydroxy-3-polyprenylbenzoate decarboxylase